jgi:hypothetical protein
MRTLWLHKSCDKRLLVQPWKQREAQTR